MNPILETVHAHLTKHDLTAVPLGDGEALTSTVTLKNLRVHLFFCADSENLELIVTTWGHLFEKYNSPSWT